MSANTSAKLSSEHNEFLERFIKEGFDNEIPRSLFHYTDSGGLNGTIAKNIIWLTSFKFMNDYSEFNHGLTILGKKLDQFLNDDKYDNTFAKMCKNIKDFMIQESNDPLMKPYVFCLSKKKDHLGQWRGYGDFGKGYCLEFDVPKLQTLASQAYFLGKVQYEPEMIETLMAELVQKWLDLCESEAKNNSNIISTEAGHDLAILLMQAAYAVAIKMKHQGFSEEEEWRLFKFIQRGSPVLKFRPHRFGIADYIELKIEPLKFIKEIMSGPCGPDYNYLKSSIDSLAGPGKSTGYRYTKSAIPFI